MNKFPKISEGVYRNGTMSQISEGLENNCKKFLRKFPRGSSGKPFPKGSKISNIVNREVYVDTKRMALNKHIFVYTLLKELIYTSQVCQDINLHILND